MEKNGQSMETAVVLEADTTEEGLALERRFIEALHGPKYDNWTLLRQEHVINDWSHFDVIHIQTSDDKEHTFYFEVNSFFGKH